MTSWVLLRGLIRESRHWGSFLDTFQSAFPDDQVFAVDLPGNGSNNRMTSPTTIANMVEATRAIVQARGVRGPCNLLAVSMGGMIATQWAQRYPTELATQILLNTSMRPFSTFTDRLLPANYRQMLRLALSRFEPQQTEQTILNLTTNQHHPHLLDHWVQWRRENPVSAANALRQLWAAARYRGPLQQPKVPTLLLASEHDRLVSVACSKAISSAWGAELRLHPSAGHDLPLDDGAWVIHQIQAWMEPLGAASDVVFGSAPAPRQGFLNNHTPHG
jgi:pimeloyl-ACP methyl ester carboxylesterase